MNRARENRLLAGVVAMLGAALVVAALIALLRGGPAGIQEAFTAATPTPVVSEQARAEAVDLLALAAARRAEGQIGAALELGNQALAAFPQYDAAQRFVQTAVPQATAVAQAGEARAAATAAAVTRQSQAGAETRRVYVSRAGLSLQRYADALASLYEKNRQAREQPALVRDAVWRSRTTDSLRVMRDSAAALLVLQPIPDGMASSVALFDQLSTETAALARDYAAGIDDAEGSVLPFTGTRTERASELTRRANVELRRGGPATP